MPLRVVPVSVVAATVAAETVVLADSVVAETDVAATELAPVIEKPPAARLLVRGLVTPLAALPSALTRAVKLFISSGNDQVAIL